MQMDPSEGTACSACGDPFACGAGRPSCWCRGVRLGDEARARAARTYPGCLCPACLRLVADGRLAGEGVVHSASRPQAEGSFFAGSGNGPLGVSTPPYACSQHLEN